MAMTGQCGLLNIYAPLLLRHCEERSDEAIQDLAAALDCFAPLAMTPSRRFPAVLNGTVFHDKKPAPVARVRLPGGRTENFDACHHGCRRVSCGLVRVAGPGAARASQFLPEDRIGAGMRLRLVCAMRSRQARQRRFLHAEQPAAESLARDRLERNRFRLKRFAL